MPEVIIPVIFVLIVTVVWFFTTYNRFIKYRNNIEEAWSRIEVALKRRFNLLPNLIRAIEGYSEHEAKIFQTKNNYFTLDLATQRELPQVDFSKSRESEKDKSATTSKAGG